jgi:hypothetical protein
MIDVVGNMYTPQELDELALADIRSDLNGTNYQISQLNGGPLKADLERYARKLKQFIALYREGGAHNAVLLGESLNY